jgi:hypothetical protein
MIIIYIKSAFYIIPMKLQAPLWCDGFQYTCIVEICRQSIELVFKLLPYFIATQKLL